MDTQDRQAIDGLFTRIADAERHAGALDPDANAFIGQKIAAQPAAPYLMAQTIVVQDQALAAAEQRIQDLERQISNPASGRASGGLFATLFGGGSTPSRSAGSGYGQQPQQPSYAPQAAGQGASPWGQTGQQGMGGQQGLQQAGRSGGGFLQGAAQTAMGVAGGMLIGSAIGSMFSGSDANAAETPAEAPADDAGFDVGGDDMEF